MSEYSYYEKGEILSESHESFVAVVTALITLCQAILPAYHLRSISETAGQLMGKLKTKIEDYHYIDMKSYLNLCFHVGLMVRSRTKKPERGWKKLSSGLKGKTRTKWSSAIYDPLMVKGSHDGCQNSDIEPFNHIAMNRSYEEEEILFSRGKVLCGNCKTLSVECLRCGNHFSDLKCIIKGKKATKTTSAFNELKKKFADQKEKGDEDWSDGYNEIYRKADLLIKQFVGILGYEHYKEYINLEELSVYQVNMMMLFVFISSYSQGVWFNQKECAMDDQVTKELQPLKAKRFREGLSCLNECGLEMACYRCSDKWKAVEEEVGSNISHLTSFGEMITQLWQEVPSPVYNELHEALLNTSSLKYDRMEDLRRVILWKLFSDEPELKVYEFTLDSGCTKWCEILGTKPCMYIDYLLSKKAYTKETIVKKVADKYGDYIRTSFNSGCVDVNEEYSLEIWNAVKPWDIIGLVDGEFITKDGFEYIKPKDVINAETCQVKLKVTNYNAENWIKPSEPDDRLQKVKTGIVMSRFKFPVNATIQGVWHSELFLSLSTKIREYIPNYPNDERLKITNTMYRIRSLASYSNQIRRLLENEIIDLTRLCDPSDEVNGFREMMFLVKAHRVDEAFLKLRNPGSSEWKGVTDVLRLNHLLEEENGKKYLPSGLCFDGDGSNDIEAAIYIKDLMEKEFKERCGDPAEEELIYGWSVEEREIARENGFYGSKEEFEKIVRQACKTQPSKRTDEQEKMLKLMTEKNFEVGFKTLYALTDRLNSVASELDDSNLWKLRDMCRFFDQVYEEFDTYCKTKDKRTDEIIAWTCRGDASALSFVDDFIKGVREEYGEDFITRMKKLSTDRKLKLSAFERRIIE